MEQLSLFDEEEIPFSKSYEDVLALHARYIYEGEKDEDIWL